MEKYSPASGQPPFCPECHAENIAVNPTETMVEDRELIEVVSCLNCYLEWQEVFLDNLIKISEFPSKWLYYEKRKVRGDRWNETFY